MAISTIMSNVGFCFELPDVSKGHGSNIADGNNNVNDNAGLCFE